MTIASRQQLLADANRLFKTGPRAQAISAFQRLLSAHPDLPDSWYNLGVLLRQTGQYEAALAAYSQALNYNISNPEDVHLNRAVIYLDGLRNGDASQRELETALRLAPNYQPALLNLASLHEDRGEQQRAEAVYDRLLAENPNHFDALSRRAGLNPANGPSDPMIMRLKKALAGQGLSHHDKAILGFALGRLLDSCGAYDDAFEAYMAANASNQAMLPEQVYDFSVDQRLVQNTISAFPSTASPETLGDAGFAPIFILGMFRSGSTLIEQILASHPAVTSGGELALIPQYARMLGGTPARVAATPSNQIDLAREAYCVRAKSIADAGQIMTDKRPDNFWHIGLIKRLFPNAKIIHTTRAPVDNCLSVFFQHLDPSITYASDLVACGQHLLAERAMMAHWKVLWPNDILTVDYQSVVIDQRGETARMLDFLNLDWDEACLSFYKAASLVRTASVWQVREPIHQRSSQRWKNYEMHVNALQTLFKTNGLAS